MLPEALADLLDAPSARDVVRELLTAVGQAFTHTVGVRDAVSDTAPASAEQALATVAGMAHLDAMLTSIDARWQVLAEQRMRAADADRGVPRGQQGRAAAQEIALARRISPTASTRSLSTSRRMVAQMPRVRSGLGTGAITSEQAIAVARALHTADPDTITKIDEAVGERPDRLDGLGRSRIRDLVAEMVQRIAPGDSRARAGRAAKERCVKLTPLPDGMARISAKIRALDAAAIMASLQLRAQADKAAGDRTAVQCLEADHLVRDVLGSENAAAPAAPVRIEVGVILSDRALFSGQDEASSAVIHGYGIVPAHVVTDTLRGRPPGHVSDNLSSPLAETTAAADSGPQEAARAAEAAAREAADADPPPRDSAFGPPGPEHPVDGEHQAGGEQPVEDERYIDPPVEAFIRGLYVERSSQELTQMESRSRAFPVGMARLVRWGDRTCRTAWCNAAIRQIDHIRPFATGGPTSIDNAQGLCTRCNLLKEHGPWSVVKERDEETGETRIRWTSPHGATGMSPTPHVPAA